MQNPKQLTEEIRPLTGLRFLAALYVVLMHLDARLPMDFLPWRAHELLKEGALGVTVFFVLSGFVLTYSHLKDFPAPMQKNAGYYGRFLFKRIARIGPAYYIGLLACIALSIRLSNLSLEHVVLNATFLQPWVPRTLGQWYGAGAWSVSAEVFFYLFFPILLPLVLRFSRFALWALFTACVVLSTVLGIGTQYGLDGAIVYNMPLTRFPEFIAGIAVGLLVLRHKQQVPQYLAVGLVGVTAIYLSYTHHYSWSTLTHLWLVIPATASLVAAMAQRESVFSWLGKELFHLGGRVSYCFYIVQLPLLLILDAALQAGRVAKHDLVLVPIFLLVNFLGAWLLHIFVENPAHKRLTKWLRKRDTKQSLIVV